jgi:hypothetical protein
MNCHSSVKIVVRTKLLAFGFIPVVVYFDAVQESGASFSATGDPVEALLCCWRMIK